MKKDMKTLGKPECSILLSTEHIGGMNIASIYVMSLSILRNDFSRTFDHGKQNKTLPLLYN